MTTAIVPFAAPKTASPGRKRLLRFARRNWLLMTGGGVILAAAILAIAAPLFCSDPLALDPSIRLQGPSSEHWFGADNLGRDVFARTIYGARISLLVGISAAICAVVGGLLIGLIAGYIRRLDGVLMRVMDGLMSIPTILLAIALASLMRGGISVLIVAIVIPQIPSVARLVRSVVLTTRERPYVEAALAGGARMPKVLWRHILPSTIPPLVVQTAYVCANSILTEAGLSFLGAGIPPEIPSWGNMISTSRLYLPIAPAAVFAPGICLAVIVLAINLLGDGLRDMLDPRMSRRS